MFFCFFYDCSFKFTPISCLINTKSSSINSNITNDNTQINTKQQTKDNISINEQFAILNLDNNHFYGYLDNSHLYYIFLFSN